MVEKNLTQRVQTEIQLHMRQADKCPYIIQMHTYLEDNENIYLVLEYCDGMELYGQLKSHKIEFKFGFPEDRVANYFYKICLGMQYLHS